MNFLTYEDILLFHDATLRIHGGLPGIRDENVLRFAVDQPRMAAFGEELYPTLAAKSAAFAFSLIRGYGFTDGNKRVGLLVLAGFLRINGYRLDVAYPEDKDVALSVAAGAMPLSEFTEWVQNHLSAVE